jgi:hypothetical protein
MSELLKEEPKTGTPIQLIMGDGVTTNTMVMINGMNTPCRRLVFTLKAGDLPEISIDFLSMRVDGVPITVEGHLVPDRYWPRVRAFLKVMDVDLLEEKKNPDEGAT